MKKSEKILNNTETKVVADKVYKTDSNTNSIKNFQEKSDKAKKKFDIKAFLLLHIILLLYSLCSVFSKLASGQEFMSFYFILFYGLVLAVLGVYAILWQQVLKKMPLTTAFSNKAVVIIWGMMWGALIFSEQITWYMIIGSIIIFAGVVLVVSDYE